MSGRFLGRGLTLRGLWERRWLSLVVLLVATLASAAAAMGPTYATAARTEIVRDNFAEAPADAQGFLAIYQPSPFFVPGERPPVSPASAREGTGVPELFHPTIRGASAPSGVPDKIGEVRITWRDGVCAHLRFVSGRCPEAPGEAVASNVTSQRYGWTLGGQALLDALVPVGEPGERQPRDPMPLTIVGIYEPIDPEELYWFGPQWFPDTTGTAVDPRSLPLYDPVFVDESTMGWAGPAKVPWEYQDTLLLDTRQLDGDDAGPLARSQDRLQRWLGDRADIHSDIPLAASRAMADHRAFGVPVILVSFELVALCWLLLFLSVADVVQARARDIGLARLRGLSRPRIWLFGLAEPLVLLALALPAGLLLSWPIAVVLSHFLLATDPPVSPGPLAWAAAAGSIVGGLLASALAARSTLTLPVTEHWRRSRSRAVGRGWVPDAIVLALVVAGLAELSAAGVVTDPSSERATSLLVPALVAVAAALAAARALPILCRRLFRLTRRRGGLAVFVALRHLGRSSGTAHTMIVLATSFTLATFAAAAWSVTARNHREVARVHNGAATALVVQVPPGSDTLPVLVDRADPGGRSAAAVAINDSGARMVAVDTQRIAAVAYWQPDFATRPLADLLPELRVEVAPRVMLVGDSVRVTVDDREAIDPLYTLALDVEQPGRSGSVRPQLEPEAPATLDEEVLVGSAATVMTRALPPSCAVPPGCELRALVVETSYLSNGRVFQGQVVISRIETGVGGAWSTVDAGLTDRDRWRKQDPTSEGSATTNATPQGLEMTFPLGDTSYAVPASFPEQVPAITVGRVDPDPDGLSAHGLDGEDFTVASVARARAAPGADRTAALVDYEMVDRVSVGLSDKVEHQVWLAPGAAARVRPALERQGVVVTDVRTVTELNRRFNRQGPGLALVLLLASAAAAAALAMARAALGLYAAGRRRSYELAALGAVGVPLRTRRAALLVEAAVSLGTGVATGVLAGMVATWLALDRVPQFTFTPASPPLTHTPDPLLVLGVAVAAFVSVGVAAVLTTTAAIRRPSGVDQLREASQ